MRANTGRGFAGVNEINRQRNEEVRKRVLALTFGGATARQVAEAMGMQLSSVKRMKVKLRRQGLLGCCMQPCTLAPDGDVTRCKWYVA